MTTARDASKCQDKNETEIGIAFCTEKMATIATIITTKMIVIKAPSIAWPKREITVFTMLVQLYQIHCPE